MVEIDNTSDTRTQVLGSTLDFIAARVAPERVSPKTFADRVRQTDLGLSLADRYLHVTYKKIKFSVLARVLP